MLRYSIRQVTTSSIRVSSQIPSTIRITRPKSTKPSLSSSSPSSSPNATLARIEPDIFKALNYKQPKNKNMALNELNTLLTMKNTTSFNHVFQQLPKFYTKGDISELEDHNKLIQLALHWNDSTIPSIIVLERDDISEDTVRQVLDLLYVKDPVMEDLQINLIYKILSKYKAIQINEFDVTQIMIKLRSYSQLNVYKDVMNLLINRVINNNNHINHLYELVKVDYKLNNPSGCFFTLKKILKFQTINEIDPRVLSMVLKMFNKNHKFKTISHNIINELDDITNPLYLDHVITSLVRSKDLERLNIIINTLSKNLNKFALSNLLKINLIFANLNNVEIIIEKMINQYKFEEYDYTSIIQSLLKRHKFQEALNFSQSIPIELACPSYICIIDHIVSSRCTGKLSDKHLLIIEELCNKFKSQPENEFWSILSSIYIKYLLKTAFDEKSLEVIVQIYENSTKEFMSSLSTKYSPFALELNEYIKLKIPAASKTVIIKNILDQAIKAKSTKFINWGCLNLLELGFGKEEIKFDLYRKLDSRLVDQGVELNDDFKSFKRNWDKATKRKFLEKREFMKK